MVESRLVFAGFMPDAVLSVLELAFFLDFSMILFLHTCPCAFCWAGHLVEFA